VSETAIEEELHDKTSADLELLHRPAIARLALPLIVLFGLADAAALFYAAREALDLGDSPLDTFLTVLMALLGFALVLPAMLLAQLLKRIYTSRLDNGVVPRPWLRLAFAIIPVLLLAAGVYAVAWIRWSAGDAEVDWGVMVIFTALATFGAFAIEFMADIPHRHLLDRLELDARRGRRRYRRHSRIAVRRFNRRDVAIHRAQAHIATVRAQISLARAAAITDSNERRAAQPGVFGTTVLEDVGSGFAALDDALRGLDDQVEQAVAAFAEIRLDSMGPPEAMSSTTSHRPARADAPRVIETAPLDGADASGPNGSGGNGSDPADPRPEGSPLPS
jgi:hypothetical protein